MKKFFATSSAANIFRSPKKFFRVNLMQRHVALKSFAITKERLS